MSGKHITGIERCPCCGAAPDRGAKECTVCLVSLDSEEARAHHRPRGNFIGELFRGMAYFPRGFGTLLGNPKLWRLASIPFLLNIVFIAAAFFLAYELSDYLQTDLATNLETWEGWWWGSLASLLKILIRGLGILSFIIVPLLVAFLFSVFGKLLFMPFMEMLSAKAEKVYLGSTVDEAFSLMRFSSDLVIAIVDAILLTACQLLLYVLLLPLNVIPVLGNILWFVLPGAIISSMDFTDLNFIRRRYWFRDRLQVWWRYRFRFFGFGLCFFLFLAIPWINILIGPFVIPTACVGGTILYLELESK